MGSTLRPDGVGKQVAELAVSDLGAGAYLVTPDGLKEIPK
jgi:hypothetical protein